MPARPPLQLECITYASGRVEIRRVGAGAKDANRAAGRANPRAGKTGGGGSEKEPTLDDTVLHAKKVLAYTGFEPGGGKRRRRGRGKRGAAGALGASASDAVSLSSYGSYDNDDNASSLDGSAFDGFAPSGGAASSGGAGDGLFPGLAPATGAPPPPLLAIGGGGGDDGAGPPLSKRERKIQAQQDRQLARFRHQFALATRPTKTLLLETDVHETLRQLSHVERRRCEQVTATGKTGGGFPPGHIALLAELREEKRAKARDAAAAREAAEWKRLVDEAQSRPRTGALPPVHKKPPTKLETWLQRHPAHTPKPAARKSAMKSAAAPSADATVASSASMPLGLRLPAHKPSVI